MLLTRRTDVEQGYRTTETYSLFVVNIDEWLRTPDNAAFAYLAGHLPFKPTDVREFIENQLNVGHVAEWLRQDEGRLAQLAGLLGLGSNQPVSLQQALDTIAAPGALEQDAVHTLINFVLRLTEGDQRTELLRGATYDETGRRVAALSSCTSAPTTGSPTPVGISRRTRRCSTVRPRPRPTCRDS